MKTSKLLVGIPTLVCAMLFVSNAFATAVPVDNPSFETLPSGGLPFGSCGTGCSFSEAAISGWAGFATGDISGQFQPGSPGNTMWFNSVPDGITIAYSDKPGTIYQNVAATTVQDGVTYTLQVDIGRRNDDFEHLFLGSADLKFGTTVCNVATGIIPNVGDWSTFTATCIGTLATAGEAITIDLNTSAIPIGFFGQGDFDNVRLDASTVPEPGTLILFGSGLLGLVQVLRRKRFAQS